MNSDQFLRVYERIADTPNAVARLREFILDLAVQGHLAAQDPTDDPAPRSIEHLPRVTAAGSRGSTKSKQRSSTVSDAQVTNEMGRVGWTRHRLGDIAPLITKGSTPTSYGHAYTDQGINFVKVESIRNGELSPKSISSFISQNTHDFLVGCL